MKIKWTDSHRGPRQISKADWKAVDIEHDTVTWDAGNDYTAEVSAKAGALLLERERGQWSQVDDADESEASVDKDEKKPKRVGS